MHEAQKPVINEQIPSDLLDLQEPRAKCCSVKLINYFWPTMHDEWKLVGRTNLFPFDLALAADTRCSGTWLLWPSNVFSHIVLDARWSFVVNEEHYGQA